MEPSGSILDYVDPTAIGSYADQRAESMKAPERYEEVMILVAGNLDGESERRSPGGPKLLDEEDLARYKTLIDLGVREPDGREWFFAFCVYGQLFPRVLTPGSKPNPNEMVFGPEDLNPWKGSPINSPPSDGRCQCCGRHISELTPFGGPGDPLVGDFGGALLVKGYRPMGSYDHEAVEASKEAEKQYKTDGYEDSEGWLVANYGEKEGKRLYYAACLCSQITASWECRDCFVLGEDEYLETYWRQCGEGETQELGA